MDKNQAWDTLFEDLRRVSEKLREQQHNSIGAEYDRLKAKREGVLLALSYMSEAYIDIVDELLVA